MPRLRTQRKKQPATRDPNRKRAKPKAKRSKIQTSRLEISRAAQRRTTAILSSNREPVNRPALPNRDVRRRADPKANPKPTTRPILSAEIRPLDIADMGTHEYDITHYQPTLFAAESFGDAVDTLSSFFLRYDDATWRQLRVS